MVDCAAVSGHWPARVGRGEVRLWGREEGEVREGDGREEGKVREWGGREGKKSCVRSMKLRERDGGEGKEG